MNEFLARNINSDRLRLSTQTTITQDISKTTALQIRRPRKKQSWRGSYESCVRSRGFFFSRRFNISLRWWDESRNECSTATMENVRWAGEHKIEKKVATSECWWRANTRYTHTGRARFLKVISFVWLSQAREHRPLCIQCLLEPQGVYNGAVETGV